MRSIILALALVSVPASAADQFDLICTAKKAQERYRVDLAKDEWCVDRCDMVMNIASVTSGLLVLAEHEPAYRGDRKSYNRVNRVTGEWEWYFADGDSDPSMNHRGLCKPAEFSGIPNSERLF